MNIIFYVNSFILTSKINSSFYSLYWEPPYPHFRLNIDQFLLVSREIQFIFSFITEKSIRMYVHALTHNIFLNCLEQIVQVMELKFCMYLCMHIIHRSNLEKNPKIPHFCRRKLLLRGLKTSIFGNEELRIKCWGTDSETGVRVPPPRTFNSLKVNSIELSMVWKTRFNTDF